MADEKRGGVSVFHERQRLQLCLLHALNNLLQGDRAFTRKELDRIADNLPSVGDTKWYNRGYTPFSLILKPHRNTLLGDYDVNVLFAALATRGKEVIWYDRRKGLNPAAVYGDKLVGIILNVVTRKFGGFWKTRHWLTVRKVNGLWYNLDSDLVEPAVLDSEEEDLNIYLDSVLSDSGEALIVLDDGRDVLNSS